MTKNLRALTSVALMGLVLAWSAGCRTANDRPGGGPVSYKCTSCNKTATQETQLDTPVCCAKSMVVTSTTASIDTYTCGCGSQKLVAKGAPAPQCCNKAMTKQEPAK